MHVVYRNSLAGVSKKYTGKAGETVCATLDVPTSACTTTRLGGQRATHKSWCARCRRLRSLARRRGKDAFNSDLALREKKRPM